MGKPQRRSIAFVCIAAVLLAALMPGASALDYAVPEPAWVLLPNLATLIRPVEVDRDQPLASPFIPRESGRAPPTTPLPHA